LAAAAAALHRYIYLDCTVTTAEWCRRRVFGFFCCPFIHWNSAAAGGISSRISFFFLQWNHRRCALSKLRVEMRRNWKGGPTYKKGRTTRTRGSMKRFDVGYTLRKRDGQTIC
jgi:hypothetical protein